MARLSIILPVYNVEKYIVRCLESIYSQHISPDLFEVIIVDDETPDTSIEIARKYLKNYSNFKIISQKNRGLGGARNSGINNASGTYIWFVDSDDEITNNSLDIVLSAIDRDPEAEIIVFDHVTDKNDFEFAIPSPLFCTTSSGIDLVLSGFMITTVWNCIYRKSFLDKWDLRFREKFKHEDSEFNLQAAVLAKKIDICKFPIYRYYTGNPGSIMNSISLANIKDYMSYLDTADKFLKKHNSGQDKRFYLAVCRYIGLSLATVFKHSLMLKVDDYQIFREELKKQKARYLHFVQSLPIKNRVLLTIQLFSSSKTFPTLIYYKKLILFSNE